ncbi:MAG: sporulation protein [Oscillospiraceae bacterium]|jgi:sporulation integral membrane protein YlbJ|nr:sporulation protein [Oscillospiraceae bacterium]
MRNKFFDWAAMLGLAAALVSLAVFPRESVAAGKSGVQICLDVIVPSLMPFFVLSSLVVELGIADKLGRLFAPITRKLFNVSGICSAAFVLGLIGGYPVGAKTAIQLYKSGQISKAETERLLSFCNNSGPAFILGVVGARVFGSGGIGILLCLAHASASVFIGILFRNWGKGKIRGRQFAAQRDPDSESAPVRFSSAFITSVKFSVRSVLNICGFVIFFTVFIRLLFLSGVIPNAAQVISSITGASVTQVQNLIIGFIELTGGVNALGTTLAERGGSVKMAAFMLGWAGLSIHCQALSFIADSGIRGFTYIAGKFLHGLLSAGIVAVLFKFLPFREPAAAYYTQQISGIATLGFNRAVLLSTLCCLAIFLIAWITAQRKRG